MANSREVDPNLVGAAGPWRGYDQTRIGCRLNDLVWRGGDSASTGDRHPGTVGGMPANWGVNATLARLNDAVHKQQVALAHLPCGKRLREHVIATLRAGDDHNTRCIAIEPVHDAWTSGIPDRSQLRISRCETMCQRPVFVARPRMHRHPWRLVDDDEILFLAQDHQRSCFGYEEVGYLRNLDPDRVAYLNHEVGFRQLLIDRNLAVTDKSCGPRSTQAWT